MFTLPSMWNLIISTLVFIIAARYLNHYLEEQGLPKGVTRGTLVFALASLISWGSGEMVEWTEGKPKQPQLTAQPSPDLQQLLKMLGNGPIPTEIPVSTETKEPDPN
jgi:hypothetical protein